MADLADYILEIARSEKAAIRLAISSVITDRNEIDILEKNLKAIRDVLGKTATRKKKSPKRKAATVTGDDLIPSKSLTPSDTELFHSKIIPLLRETVINYERMQDAVEDSEWNLNLQFINKFNKFEVADLDSIKTTHADVVEQEKMAVNLSLVISYHRGLIYLKARKFVPADSAVKEWFTETFQVAYVTIHRYVSFTILIKTYPRLLFSGLTFTQFSSHHNRIKNHLITDTELANQLNVDFNMCVFSQNLSITPGNVHSCPETNLSFAVNPDHMFEDSSWYYQETDVTPNRAILNDKDVIDFSKDVFDMEEERQLSVLQEEEEQSSPNSVYE